MVNVSGKQITKRTAKAQATVPAAGYPQSDQWQRINNPKGTGLSDSHHAGVMGAKQTSSLIPFCHPIALEDCQIKIHVKGSKL